MKKTPERIESLAAEYVLGSLTGRARQRFERWMMQSMQVRQEVWFWEERLGQLTRAVPSVNPAPSVWAEIEQRLWPTVENATQARPSTGWFWPSWSLLASAAVVVLAVILVAPPQQGPVRDVQLTGAVVQSDVSDPLWLVSESGNDRLRLRSVAAVDPGQGKDYELWVVPGEGSPVSLGVMAVGGIYEVTLTEEARRLLASSRTLAISLEPSGGSPTGVPTGPVLHISRLYEM
ncbi:anti-sigma factor [Marinobacter sp. NSM]|uniref:anti-sigma factor n=1 Tax=Marinobacter sp. NSM TaxID=3458004 RepID=UPI0040353130